MLFRSRIANRDPVLSSRIWFIYFVKSNTTATLQHWPAKLVPAPRARTGAPYFLHAATAAITSASSRGTTMPMGICR